MKVHIADITELWKHGETVCITVSLEVRRKTLHGVLDRGNALDMAREINGLPRMLGEFIIKGRGEVGMVCERVIAFFTKPAVGRFERGLPDEIHRYTWGTKIPGSHCMADPVIVARSARQLIRFAEKEKLRRVFLPIPGVGDGRLDVDEISEALDVIEHSPRIVLVSKSPIENPRIEMASAFGSRPNAGRDDEASPRMRRVPDFSAAL